MGVDPVTASLVATAVIGGASAYSSYRSERATKLQAKRQERKLAQQEAEAKEDRRSLIQTSRRQLGGSYNLNRTSSRGLVSSGTSASPASIVGGNKEILG